MNVADKLALKYANEAIEKFIDDYLDESVWWADEVSGMHDHDIDALLNKVRGIMRNNIKITIED